MTMPRLSGLQTQIRMRELGRDLPVVAVSALDDNQVRERARELGASFFLRKPVDDQALMDAIAWVSAATPAPPRALR
jgi:CheY-like chemotaxis protein